MPLCPCSVSDKAFKCPDIKPLPCSYHFVSEHFTSCMRYMKLLQDQKLRGELSSLKEPLLGGLLRAERGSFGEQ